MFYENKKNKLILLLLITNLLSICLILFFILNPNKDNKSITINNKIIVQISGEVNNPNIYEIDEGSRLYELVDLAGGLTKNADEANINLSLILFDEMKIVIPSINDNITKKININTASITQLMTLNGIGEVKANAIINYREKIAPFKTIEDIKKVNGIGDKTFENIKDYICV